MASSVDGISVHDDLGAEVVSEVKERREFKDEGIEEWKRGFSRSPLGVKQHVWSEDPVDDEGIPAWRVHVRTQALKGFQGTPDQLGALSAEMSRNKLCAVVRNAADPTRLELASSLHVNAANRAWAPRLLVLVARQQLAAARHLAGVPALSNAGFLPDVSARHPESRSPVPGPNELDSIGPEAWSIADSYGVADIATDMTQALAVLQDEWQLHAVRTPLGVVAAVPCQRRASGDASALIEIEARPHSRLGRGLSVSLNLPGWADMSDALAVAEAELGAGCRTDVLGGWFVTDGMLTHRSFFPAHVAAKAVAPNVAATAARRAFWICGGRDVPRRVGLEPDQASSRRPLRFPPGASSAPNDRDE